MNRLLFILIIILLSSCSPRFTVSIALKNNLTNITLTNVVFRHNDESNNIGNLSPGAQSSEVIFMVQEVYHISESRPSISLYVADNYINSYLFSQNDTSLVLRAEHSRNITIISNFGTGTNTVTTNDSIEYIEDR